MAKKPYGGGFDINVHSDHLDELRVEIADGLATADTITERGGHHGSEADMPGIDWLG